MSNAVIDSIKENKKHQKDFIIDHLISKFTLEDRILIAKLLKQQYREGFLNGMKMKQF